MNIKNEVKLEFQRVYKSRGLLVSLALGSLIAILQFINIVLPYKDYVYIEKLLYPASVFARWLGGELASAYPTLYYFLLPILVVLPNAGSYKEDLKSGYIKQILTRTTKEQYLVSKYLVTFLIGGIVAVFPLILNFMLTTTVFPAIIPQSSTSLFSIFSVSMLGNLFYTHPYCYLLIYLIINFVFWGLFATVALTAAYVCEYYITTLLVPFIIYLLVYGIAQLSGFVEICPLYVLRPSQPVATNILVLFIEFVILYAIGGAYYYVGKKRDIL